MAQARFNREGYCPKEGQAVIRDPDEQPVFICSSCGRGFLIHPGCKLDPVPVFFGSFFQSDGPCLGKITAASRAMLIRNLDREESKYEKTP